VRQLIAAAMLTICNDSFDHRLAVALVAALAANLSTCIPLQYTLNQPTNRPIMPTYKVEKAKTGRSGCKKCKDKIEKDEIRIGTITEAKEGHSLTTYVMLPCKCSLAL
jgi:hypothetical protein